MTPHALGAEPTILQQLERNIGAKKELSVVIAQANKHMLNGDALCVFANWIVTESNQLQADTFRLINELNRS